MKPAFILVALGLAAPTLIQAHTQSAAPMAHDHGTAHAHVYAFGQPGKATSATRTLRFEMTDAMRFVALDSTTIQPGETVRFVIINRGRIPHEFSLGDPEFQKQHAAMMQTMPNMQHTDPNTVTVAPGQRAELVWTFAALPRKTVLEIACHVPGHYQAGMKATLTVGG